MGIRRSHPWQQPENSHFQGEGVEMAPAAILIVLVGKRRSPSPWGENFTGQSVLSLLPRLVAGAFCSSQ